MFLLIFKNTIFKTFWPNYEIIINMWLGSHVKNIQKKRTCSEIRYFFDVRRCEFKFTKYISKTFLNIYYGILFPIPININNNIRPCSIESLNFKRVSTTNLSFQFYQY